MPAEANSFSLPKPCRQRDRMYEGPEDCTPREKSFTMRIQVQLYCETGYTFKCEFTHISTFAHRHSRANVRTGLVIIFLIYVVKKAIYGPFAYALWDNPL